MISKLCHLPRRFSPLSNSEPTPLSQPLSKPKQRHRATRAKHHAAREQTHAAINPDALKHGPSKQNRRKRKQTATQTVGRKDARRISGVDIRDVQKDALGNEEDAKVG